MARPEAVANQVADAVVALLEQIDPELEPAEWLMDVRPRVSRVSVPAALDAPAFVVHIGDWADEPFSGGVHRTKGRVWIDCYSMGDDVAEKLLNSMVADAVHALTSADERLGGLVLISYTDARYSPNAELSQRSGRAVATLDVGMLWEWRHGAP